MADRLPSCVRPPSSPRASPPPFATRQRERNPYYFGRARVTSRCRQSQVNWLFSICILFILSGHVLPLFFCAYFFRLWTERAEGGRVRTPHPNKDRTHLLAVSCPDTQCCTNMCSCQWLPNDVDLFKFHIHIVAQRAAEAANRLARAHTPWRVRAPPITVMTLTFLFVTLCVGNVYLCSGRWREGGDSGGFVIFF